MLTAHSAHVRINLEAAAQVAAQLEPEEVSACCRGLQLPLKFENQAEEITFLAVSRRCDAHKDNLSQFYQVTHLKARVANFDSLSLLALADEDVFFAQFMATAALCEDSCKAGMLSHGDW